MPPSPDVIVKRPRGRRAARSPVAVVAAGELPLVPLWFVCTRAHWRACGARREIAPARSRVGGAGLRVALHAGVGAMALHAFGPCRGDLVAVALHPRRLPGVGPATCVRIDLDADGVPAFWLDVPSVAIDAGMSVEPLVPLDDDAGYHPPRLQTAGDRDRARDRDGLRRTR